MPKTITTGIKQAQKAAVDWDTQSIHLKPRNQKSLREQVNAAYKRIVGDKEPSRNRKRKNFDWIFNK